MFGIEDFDVFHGGASVQIVNGEYGFRHDDAIIPIQHGDAAGSEIGLHTPARPLHRHKVGGALGEFIC